MKASETNALLDTEVVPLSHWLTVIAFSLFGFSILFSIVSLHCLYADGSYQLTEVLRSGGFVSIAKNRDCADFIFQFPVLLAIKLGVTDLYWLQLAFGVGCFLSWPVAMTLCWIMAPRHLWLAMLGCAVGYLNAAFVSAGEYNVAHAFFWPVLYALLFVRPLTPFAAGVLLLSSVILVRSYESMLFLGPLLACLAVWRTLGRMEKGWARGVLVLSGGVLGLAAVIAVNGVRHPQAPDNLGGFKQGLQTMFLFPNWNLGWTLVWLGLIATACVERRLFSGRLLRIELPLLAGAVLVWGLWPLINPGALDTQIQYHYRAIQFLSCVALLLVGCALVRFPEWFSARRNHLVALGAALLLAQSLGHISATWQWRGFVKEWRMVLKSHSGVIPFAATPFGRQPRGYQAMNFDWNWANPSLSVMLSPDGHVKSLILPPSLAGWHPFNPLNPAELPELRRYGIDYSEYLAALGKAPVSIN